MSYCPHCLEGIIVGEDWFACDGCYEPTHGRCGTGTFVITAEWTDVPVMREFCRTCGTDAERGFDAPL